MSCFWCGVQSIGGSEVVIGVGRRGSSLFVYCPVRGLPVVLLDLPVGKGSCHVAWGWHVLLVVDWIAFRYTCISWHLHNPCFIVPHNVLVTLYSRTSLIQNTLGALLNDIHGYFGVH